MSRELTEFSAQIDEQFEVADTQWEELWQAVLRLFTAAPVAANCPELDTVAGAGDKLN